MTVFLDYSRETLDAEYDNRSKVDSAESHLSFWSARSSAVRAQGNHRLDVVFGPSLDEKLDVFLVDQPDAPIHFFIHGGYWHLLSKAEFSFVAQPFRLNGAITVVINYALIPRVDMNELVRQCRKALAWTWKNAHTFGGDQNQIHVSGHSAGGHLVGMLCATDWRRFDSELPSNPIKSATSLSGLMDLEPISKCFLGDILHLSEQDIRRNSPVQLQRNNLCPLTLAVGGKEGREYLRQSAALVKHWSGLRPKPQLKVLEDEDHFTIVEQLDDPESEVSRLLLTHMSS